MSDSGQSTGLAEYRAAAITHAQALGSVGTIDTPSDSAHYAPEKEQHRQQEYDDLVEAALERRSLESLEVSPPGLSRNSQATLTDGSSLRGGADAPAEAPAEVAVDVRRIHRKENAAERRKLVDQLLATQDQDNLRLLTKLRERMDRVGIKPDSVVVKFDRLTAEANVSVGSRGMPTVLNSYVNAVETVLTKLRIIREDKHRFTILKDCSSVLKPGRFTLLLGPPGSGKTTLLKALAGIVNNGQDGLKLDGRITFNDEGFDSFKVRRTAAYVDQIDSHLAELTVRETLDFANRCMGPGHSGAYIEELKRREKEMGIAPDPEGDAYLEAASALGKRHNIDTDIMLRVLGLEVCADTIVGNQILRGVSGGQRKRVTTGEMVVGPAKTMFMDEISTGLDSSTTWLIVNCIRNWVHLQDATVLMALLQPPPEVFELFDDVLLLSEGTIVYHGPVPDVLPFFQRMGFDIPERKGVADFLQEVTSYNDQAQYWVRKDTPHRFIPVKEMSEIFATTEQGRSNLDALATPFGVNPHAKDHTTAVALTNGDTNGHLNGHKDGRHTGHNGRRGKAPGGGMLVDPLVRTEYALTGWAAFKACLRREWTLMLRNYFIYAFKTFQVTFVALVASTLFLRTNMSTANENDGQLYLGILFYSIVHVMFNGYAEMSFMVSALPVFFKQRGMHFFPAWSFSMPTVLLRLPYSTVEGAIWSIIVYWLVGMAPTAGRFFVFMAYMIMLHQMALGLFRLMGALGKEYERTNAIGSMCMIIVILLGGFVLAKDSIHPWWIWGFWLSPITYAQIALAVNEFKDDRWSTPLTRDGVTKPLGIWILEDHDFYTEDYWRWMGLLVLLGYAIVFNIACFTVLSFSRVSHKNTTLFSEEFIAARELNRVGAPPTEGARKRKGLLPSLTLTKSKGDTGSNISLTSLGSGAASVGKPAAPAAARPAATLTADTRQAVATAGDATAATAAAERAETGGKGHKGMSLPFTPMAMAFKNICYSVDLPASAPAELATPDKAGTVPTVKPQLQLLSNITGTFRPGVLTALMGVSGAGKTTLMDVLAGRKTSGTITGEIYVDGFPKVQSTFSRVCGYVEQNDIHSPRTTVREALVFSAAMRLYGRKDREVLQRFVDDIMELVELVPIRDALVGIPGVFGLSVEQRKRVTIAVELVANPSFVLMDEPTSGLDARAAAIVMRTVRNTVNTGRTVVCTIHQPSIDIFEAFDELLLLKRGGRTMYHGPLGTRSADLVAYFNGVPGGVPPIKEGLNPATWMLDISTIGMETKLGLDFADVYDNSQLARRTDALVVELSQPKPGAVPLHFEHQYACGFWEQMHALGMRNVRSYWRHTGYNGIRFAYCTVLGLLLGSIYWGMGYRQETSNDIFNISGALVICIAFLGTSNASGVQPVVAFERPVYYRERASSMYSAIPYTICMGAIELPYVLVQSFLFGLITFFMIHFEYTAANFFWYVFFTFLTLVFFTMYGAMAVAVVPQVTMAAIMSAMFYSIWFIFAGFFISQPNMPKWWSWYYWLDPLSYALYGIITSQLGNDMTIITNTNGQPQTVKSFLSESLSFNSDFVGWCVLIMVGFILMFWAVICYAYKRFNFSKR